MAQRPGNAIIYGVIVLLPSILRPAFRLEKRLYAALPGWDYLHLVVFRSAFWFVVLSAGYLVLTAR